MLLKSQSVLLKLLQTVLFGIENQYPSNIDWDNVVVEAKDQAVLGLVSSIIPFHNESIEHNRMIYMRILYEQDKLLKLLDKHNIPCVILKGSAASIYYPKPYLRTMGDVDFLVTHTSFFETVNLLESNGYRYICGKSKDGTISNKTREIEYSKNGILFELHEHFSTPGYDVDEILEEAISRREYHNLCGLEFPMLPKAENGLVLLGHINQHLRNSLLGLRQIIDWAMYVHSVAGDESWFVDFTCLADNAGLLKLAAYVTSLCNRYLGLPERIEWGIKVDDSLTEELITAVFHDGNFGKKTKPSLSSDEENVRNTFYGIKRSGFFNFFCDIGLNRSEFCMTHSTHRVLAFVFGLFLVAGSGIKAFFKNHGIFKQISEGNKRYKLYNKIGVKNGPNRTE